MVDMSTACCSGNDQEQRRQQRWGPRTAKAVAAETTSKLRERLVFDGDERASVAMREQLARLQRQQ
ncbi:hypothetical protein SESBI_45561 [Sesbania bispinosa]|nr:hypothetical protein SESBI_45561 [Sesbania bispinosa]